MAAASARGGCLCGAVRYRVDGPLRPVVACHCSQCRRTSGHYVAASGAAWKDLTIDDEDALTWYRSSPMARRGFCRICGGNLFWAADGRDDVSIAAGTLDPPTGLSTVLHICIEDRSDYYGIPQGEPVQEGREHRLGRD
jgi:hypothetical protein